MTNPVARPAPRPPFAGLMLLAAVALVPAGCGEPTGHGGAADSTDVYEWRSSIHPGGTGKYYQGREIAEVLGHVGAEWLERPARETEELPGRVVRALELGPSDVVADIGAGTGYFTFRLQGEVPLGKVYAVDIDPDMLDIIRERVAVQDVDNVVPVLGSVTDPNLPPNQVDVALIVYSYPQFSHPYEMMHNIHRALKPGGRVVLVEYRGEDPTLPIDPIYKLTEEQARKELAVAGLRWRETRDVLPQQHFMVFEKPVDG